MYLLYFRNPIKEKHNKCCATEKYSTLTLNLWDNLYKFSIYNLYPSDIYIPFTFDKEQISKSRKIWNPSHPFCIHSSFKMLCCILFFLISYIEFFNLIKSCSRGIDLESSNLYFSDSIMLIEWNTLWLLFLMLWLGILHTYLKLK